MAFIEPYHDIIYAFKTFYSGFLSLFFPSHILHYIKTELLKVLSNIIFSDLTFRSFYLDHPSYPRYKFCMFIHHVSALASSPHLLQKNKPFRDLRYIQIFMYLSPLITGIVSYFFSYL